MKKISKLKLMSSAELKKMEKAELLKYIEVLHKYMKTTDQNIIELCNVIEEEINKRKKKQEPDPNDEIH